MSTYELIVSVLCLIAGFVGVSWWIDGSRPLDKFSKPEPDAPTGSPGTTGSSGTTGSTGTAGAAVRSAGRTSHAWNVVLDVDASANRATIVAAYRAKISQYHPDKVARMGPEIRALATERTTEINAAYEAAMRALAPRR